MRRAAAALLFAAALLAQNSQVQTFRSPVDDSEQPYALYLPPDFNPATTYPLVITLHGAGSDERLNLRQVFGQSLRGRAPSAHFGRLPQVEFIVAAPYARGSMGYDGIAEKDVYAVRAEVERRFHIDLDRVYLTGVDTGGGGALRLGLTRPDRWAALAPVCADVPAGLDEFAANALDLPVKLFHGDQDPAVPVASARRWYRQLLDAGGQAEYIEYPGVRHDCWDFAYRDAGIFGWFAQFRRNRWPERVRFATRAYQYDAAYWVQFDGLTPGTPARIDARFTGRNRLEVTTSGLEGFTLKLAGHPRYSAAAPVVATVDGVAFRRRAAGEMSFERREGKWRPGRYAPLPGGKRPGAEGPIGEAVAARHVYVYGTADHPAAEELQRRRAEAAAAAEWSTPRRHLSVAFPVKADTAVTARDLEEANLVLFGTRETNSLVARFGERFPIALNPGAADYGLLFITPLPNGRYALVDSGLAWWTGADQAHRPGYRVLGAPFELLATFPDYVLFRGSLTEVVDEGRFDNDWKLPAGAAERMRRSGAVVVR